MVNPQLLPNHIQRRRDGYEQKMPQSVAQIRLLQPKLDHPVTAATGAPHGTIFTQGTTLEDVQTVDQLGLANDAVLLAVFEGGSFSLFLSLVLTLSITYSL